MNLNFKDAFTEVGISDTGAIYFDGDKEINCDRFVQNFRSDDGVSCDVIVMRDIAGTESIQVTLKDANKNYGYITDVFKQYLKITEKEIPPTAINLASIIYRITDISMGRQLVQLVNEVRSSR